MPAHRRGGRRVTAASDTSEPTAEQLLEDAIRALTAAARLTHTLGAGTEHERQVQADWAEFVTLAVAGAAANLGSVSRALAGRPGSWEADAVRGMLVSTVGEDPAQLLQHRTEPLTVVVDVDEIMTDLGVWELYDQAQGELDRRYAAIGVPTVCGVPGDPAFEAALAQLEPATDEQEAQMNELAELGERLEQQRERDWTAYGEAFRQYVLAAAGDLLPGLDVPVEVVAVPTVRDAGPMPAQLTRPTSLPVSAIISIASCASR